MAEMRTRRQFTREFEQEAVRLATAGDRALNQVARDLGVRPDLLRQWRRQAEGQAEAPRGRERPGRGQLTSQDEEIRRLRRELAQVRAERDILGRATAFFAEGLRAKATRRFRVTTQSDHAHPVAPNVLARRFDEARPDRVWVADITYLSTRAGWLYLAVVLDVGTRAVVGWAMRHTLERGLTLDALEMAVRRRRPAPGVLHHADRGSQYACRDYRARLAAHGMT